MRRWLTGLVILLLTPSLLFASLWFQSSFNNVRALDDSLSGVALLEELGPVFREKALTGKLVNTPIVRVSELQEKLPKSIRQETIKFYRSFLIAPEIGTAIRLARKVSTLIARDSNIASHISHEAAFLPYLASDRLLATVAESSDFVLSGQSFSQKTEINIWDKIQLPVQGGQFKVAADNVAAEAEDYIERLEGEDLADLKRAALAFRSANSGFQSKGADLLSSAISANRAADINFEPVLSAYPDLANASFDLWQNTLNYISQDLMQQREATLVKLLAAGAAGLFVLCSAFGIGLILCQSFANRTMRKIEDLGFHDPLTGLANRRALMRKIEASEGPVAGAQGVLGVAHIDLRHFREINDELGNDVGDAILRAVAHDLSDIVEPDDFLARTGGTEFTILKSGRASHETLEDFADLVVWKLCAHRTINGHSVQARTSIGLATVQHGQPLCDQVLTDAALALRAAKSKGPGEICRFTPQMRESFEQTGEIAKKLIGALSTGDIVPWYQPQVDIQTGEIVGAETLIRWIDDGKVVYPGAFLPAAEEAGYMELLDSSVRKKAMKMAAALLKGRSGDNWLLGLNVTATVLADPDAVDEIYHEVIDAGLESRQISIEILEAVMIDEAKSAPIRANIARLSDLGFHIELDDFGTGHSSISSLRDLKIDRVKIDRSFISGVDTDPDLQKFTSALISLARSLDISVLAEGVETAGERDWLAANGCNFIQGYLISKAVPEDTFCLMVGRKELNETYHGRKSAVRGG